MKINVLSILPQVFHPFLKAGIIGKAVEKGIVNIGIINIRDFACDSYGTVDDYPYGGGPGMIMKVEPIVRALESIEEKGRVILLSPRGRIFNQDIARELSLESIFTLICGRYKGVDERVRDFIDGEISVGDYILSGGEIAAMVLIDASVRLLPGAVSDPASVSSDSFEIGLLNGPNYTRPRVFRGKKVPDILLSGNHGEIEKWRKKESIRITREYREDILRENNDS